jgi:hypothetical protein
MVVRTGLKGEGFIGDLTIDDVFSNITKVDISNKLILSVEYYQQGSFYVTQTHHS